MSATQKQLIFSLFACALLFAGVLLWGHPIYNSGDDVYLLYLIGGGFGDPPTQLLHYNFGFHPLLGALVKMFFQWFPNINGYTFLLYIIHFACCLSWLNSFVAGRHTSLRILLFLLVFLVFETPLLLNPTFSNTAMVLALTGFYLLIRECRKTSVQKKNTIIPFLFIILSSWLRVHTLIPVAVISLPVLVYYNYRRPGLLLYLFGIPGMVILLFIILQMQYYHMMIPHWDLEESYRQTVFSYSNQPRANGSDSLGDAKAFLDNGLFFDKQFLSINTIREITHEQPRIKSLSGTDGYWLFINSRIYCCAVAFLFFFSFILLGKTLRILMSISFLVMMSMLVILLLFKKLPGYLFVCALLFYSLLLLHFIFKETAPGPVSRKISNPVFYAGLLSLFVWGGIHFQKTAVSNKAMNKKFICSFFALQRNQDKLFVVTDNHFPMDYFSVWDIPKHFELKNLLYRDLWLNNSYSSVYNRFSIRSAKDLAINKNVIFAGKEMHAIENYFHAVWLLPVHFTPADPTFSCFEARRLVQ